MSEANLNFGSSRADNLSKEFEKYVHDVESKSNVRVTDGFGEIEINEFEVETLIAGDNNLVKEFEKNSDGSEVETLTGDNNNLSRDFEKLMDNSGGLELESDTSEEKEEKEAEKNNDDTCVVLETDSDAKAMGTEKKNDETGSKKKEYAFGVSDLVWGKVRSHPWWPGQIFDPSDASKNAEKYSKKDGFLIAYFGDKTFAWNEEAKIKPFRDRFVSMEKQSKTESFIHAIDCALGEVSRRVEFGLACKCLSGEVYEKIKTQTVVNAGIRKESSTREGGDVYSSAESFEPSDLVGYVESLARPRRDVTNKLEFVTAQAQLLAFNRYKGFTELPEYLMFGGFLTDVVEHGNTENDGDGLLVKELGIKGGSKRRKKLAENSLSRSEKERSMSDSMRKSQTRSSVKKRKADTYVVDNTMVEEKNDLKQKQFSDVGKRICSVIPVLKDGGNGSLLKSCGKKVGRKRATTPADYPSPDEILSHLYAAARGPIKGYGSLSSSVAFLSDMRNFEKSEHEKSSDRSASKEEGEEELSKTDPMEAECFEDSYWTDRVVVNTTKEQVLFEPETVNGNTVKPESPNGNGIVSAESDPNSVTKMETDEESNPTALILNFTDIESVPSQTHLNNIFRRYGPLKETGTEVLKKSKRAKVIFKRRADAETAFSSSGKFSIFGRALVSYRLHYLPAKEEQKFPAKKRSKKGADVAEGNDP